VARARQKHRLFVLEGLGLRLASKVGFKRARVAVALQAGRHSPRNVEDRHPIPLERRRMIGIM
jgi:hypothetical protein